MKKLVFFPSDPIEDYINKGRTYDFLDEYYNPGGYFDEVYCLSPWGTEKEKKIGNITYICEKPSEFKKVIKKIKPDVIRGYGGYCCADWISISKVKDIPTLVSVHDTNPELIHESLKYADMLICMSEAVKNAVLKKVAVDPTKIVVMPNRIDVDLFAKKEDKSYFARLDQMFGNGKHILHIGRKAKQKNLDTVIRALQYLPQNVVCIFVGQGDVSEYRDLAQRSNVLERCFFVDRVPNNELPLWYSWCDCMCTPSRWEGFGYVFIEAAACEAAVITSNIRPMSEYLTNGLDSILIDEYENPEKLAEAIKITLSNTDKVKEMKRAAREVGLKFAKEDVDRQEVEIYKKVIEGSANNKINYWLKFKANFKSII